MIKLLSRFWTMIVSSDSEEQQHIHTLSLQVAYTQAYLPHAVAVVGLESTLYTMTEDAGLVEVCAVMYSPNITCPIEFPFNVYLSTTDGTAGKH